MKTRLFLFDLDGTLVSTGGAGTRALSQAFLELHRIEEAHDLLQLNGKTDHAIFREIMKAANRAEPTTDDLITIGHAYLRHLEREMKTATVKIMRGAMDFVKKASDARGVLAGLGTGNLERGARLKLEPVGFNAYFEFGGFGSDAEDRAEMLGVGHRRAEAVAGSSIDPSDVFVIGDTPLDVLAARRRRFHAVAVATGVYSYEDLKATKPDFLFHDLTEADALLERA